MEKTRKSTLHAGTIRADDVAARLGISRSTFYKWQAQGLGPRPAVKHGRTALWSKEAVEAYLNGDQGHGDMLNITALQAGAAPRHVVARLKLAAGLIHSASGFVQSAGGMDKLDSPGMRLTLLGIEELVAQSAGRIGFWPELLYGAEPDPGQPIRLPCAVGGGPAKSFPAAWVQLEAAEACLLDCWPHLGKIEFRDSYKRNAYIEIAHMDSIVSAALGRKA